ncbi:hypothetical protein QYE76_000956 [Lolium multiflorum]|uniref:Transposase (putative) gypsy type domain-containing protein n=1 Tax=Lolium multiflorum TaxID=4521 RepID=A0AAD8VZ81_LOLMU|nr:hypothetical protein QYE76_000956 [Lolium multiflorum]
MATEDLEWERSKISNQDMNLLKRLGFTKEKDALRFPHEESYPKPPMEYRVSFVDHLIRGLSPPIHEFLRGLLFVYGLQLHQLTPNSILHVSIFITLCECFLGVQPNWALWKRIFCLRRNGSHGVAYNIGGVVICVRSDVDYFDVKFPDSVQGWRKRWLYVHEEGSDSIEYNIAPFDGKAKILRRRSWDDEASEEEKLATEALMTRIRELQSTRGKELSGIQITAYFLRIRMQPLQARKNPLWMYAGDEDVERLSIDLSAKDLEKLIRRISKLSKKDTIPSSCKVAPFCRANPLPKGHLVLSSLPPLPEGGEVEERAVVTDDNQGASRPESGVGDSHKSAASLEKETEAEVSSSTRSSLPAASPKGKRKRDEAIDSGTSKANTSRAGKLHSMPRKKLWIFTVLHSSAPNGKVSFSPLATLGDMARSRQRHLLVARARHSPRSGTWRGADSAARRSPELATRHARGLGAFQTASPAGRPSSPLATLGDSARSRQHRPPIVRARHSSRSGTRRVPDSVARRSPELSTRHARGLGAFQTASPAYRPSSPLVTLGFGALQSAARRRPGSPAPQCASVRRVEHDRRADFAPCDPFHSVDPVSAASTPQNNTSSGDLLAILAISIACTFATLGDWPDAGLRDSSSPRSGTRCSPRLATRCIHGLIPLG